MQNFYIQRTGGSWQGFLDTEEGKQTYRFDTLAAAHNFAIRHNLNAIMITF